MKTVTQDWDWWAYLFRVTHREQIEGITHWDDQLVEFLVAAYANHELPTVPYDADHPDRLVVVARKT